MKNVLHVIDGDVDVDSSTDRLYWRGINLPAGALSLSRIITENGNRLRARYLDFIDRLSERVCEVDGLEIRSGLNLWRFSHLKEKVHSDLIYNVLGLYVLEDLVKEKDYRRIVLYSSDLILRKAVCRACIGWSVEFSAVRLDRSYGFSLRTVVRAMPHPILGIIFFFQYLFRRLSLRPDTPGQSREPAGDPRLQIVSYFPNIDMDAARTGYFRSQYWGRVNELLDERNIAAQWLLLYIRHPQLPDYGKASRFINQLNASTRRRGSRQAYVLLDDFLRPRLAARTFFQYLGLCLRGKHHGDLLKAKSNGRGTEAALLILLRRDWLSSVRGVRALEACLWTNLFEAAIGVLPDTVSGCFYLYENQPWEQALLYAVRNRQDLKSVGIQHSSVRFFDFRYFDKQTGAGCYAEPDRIAVNGQGARNALIESGVAAERLIEVEAVRYLYLSEASGDHKPGEGGIVDAERKHLLVLTDYLLESASESLTMLAGMLVVYSGDLVITIKSHPFLPVTGLIEELGLTKKVTVVDEPLEKLWAATDVVFSSNQTSAALESVYNGISTVVAISSRRINANPLVGIKGVTFVSSAEELAKAILDGEKPQIPGDYFYLDNGLPRWDRLLREWSPYSQEDNRGVA